MENIIERVPVFVNNFINRRGVHKTIIGLIISMEKMNLSSLTTLFQSFYKLWSHFCHKLYMSL